MKTNFKRAINNKDIEKIFIQIEELKLIINKKEDDLKNEINEKDDIIKEINKKLLDQENQIKNNENEIKKLNIIIKELKEKNEEKLKEKDKKINEINNKLLNDEEGINKTNHLNEKMENINDMLFEKEKNIKNIKIFENNRNNISKFSSHFYFKNKSFRSNFKDDLMHLNDLEKDYNLLSSIGIKLLFTEKVNEIEGFIKAPENSPYRNGIFNFLIKFDMDYPENKPQLKIKTKIFHAEVSNDGHCIRFLNIWDEKNSKISLILIGLYEFFFSNDKDTGYDNEAYKIYKKKNPILFEQKCQECIKNNSIDKFDDKLKYLFQEYEKTKTNYPIFNFIFVFIKESKAKLVELNKVNNFLKDLFKENYVLIVGNKIYFSLISSKELLNNRIIFVAPNLI